MKMVALIPVHLASVRLPQKALLQIERHPMIAHVYFRVLKAKCFDDVFVVTGDPEIISVLEKYDIKYIRSYDIHENGTSRCHEASLQIDADVVCVVQGDEPLIDPGQLKIFSEKVRSTPSYGAWNAVCDLQLDSQMGDLDVVKCIINQSGEIIYIFRTPHLLNSSKHIDKYTKKIMGLFAFKKDTLAKFCGEKSSNLAIDQNIEQLGILDRGHGLKSIHLSEHSYSINTRDEAEAVRQAIASDTKQQNLIKTLFGEGNAN